MSVQTLITQLLNPELFIWYLAVFAIASVGVIGVFLLERKVDDKPRDIAQEAKQYDFIE